MRNLVILFSLILSGCNDVQLSCEWGNDIRKSVGWPLMDCSDKPNDKPRNKPDWREVYKKGPKHKIPGKFKVVDKNSPYYKCYGTIQNGPYFDDLGSWNYYFTTFKCGKDNYHIFNFFKEDQIKRTGNLAD